VVLKRKPQRIEIPQACNQVISLTTITASTRHPFHSMYTGQLSKKLISTRKKIPPKAVRKVFMFALTLLLII